VARDCSAILSIDLQGAGMFLPRAMVVVGLVMALTASARGAEPADWAREHVDELVDLYKHFHQTPELSFAEKNTSARFAAELKEAGVEVTKQFGGYGVVGILANGDGPRLMLRTDLDALPVTEKTDLVYASRVKTVDEDGQETGVMHACGHDIHITNLIGVARYLSANKDRWRGTVMFIGQPAEERGGGAKIMLDAGLFEKFPKPDFALALHVDSTLAAGKVGYRPGFSQANVDSVDIIVRGRGGHGAHPNMTIDPIVEAARLILDLQTIVSREIKPTEPAVVTVGSIHGGTKHNVIGDTVHLQLTVRSYDAEVRKKLHEAIRRKALAAAASSGAPQPTVLFSDGTPAVHNDEKLVERVVPVFRRTLGDDNVVPVELSMGGEDFSQYGLAGVPIFMFRLGSIEPKRLAGYDRVGEISPPLHSARYYPDPEPTLLTGVTAMSAAVLDLLPSASSKDAKPSKGSKP
jgi:amidohydrolase